VIFSQQRDFSGAVAVVAVDRLFEKGSWYVSPSLDGQLSVVVLCRPSPPPPRVAQPVPPGS
jgi:hypothetical protein